MALFLISVVIFLAGMHAGYRQTFPFRLIDGVKRRIVAAEGLEWQNTYQEATAARFATLPGTAEIVFLGDSHIANVDWRDYFPRKDIANRGIGGDRIDGILARAHEVLSRNPRIVVLQAGTNDVLSGRLIEEIVRDYDRLISGFGPDTKIIMNTVPVCSPKACYAWQNAEMVALNTRLRSLAQKHGATLVDINSLLGSSPHLTPETSYDGLHLNARSVQIWSKALTPPLQSAPSQE